MSRMLPNGELLVRHPRQWLLDVLFVWSILTLVGCLLRLGVLVAFHGPRVLWLDF